MLKIKKLRPLLLPRSASIFIILCQMNYFSVPASAFSTMVLLAMM